MKNFFVCCLIVCFLLIAGYAGAVALKVTPSELKIKTGLGVSAEKELVVENPADKVALYEVYPDDFSDLIKIIPASFILESKDSKKITLEVRSKEKGVFSTHLSVVSRPLSDRQFKASSGVKIPLEVIVSEEKGLFLAFLRGLLAEEISVKSLVYILILIAIPIIFLVLLFFWRKKMLR